jgi:neutral ceramidase
MRPFAVALMASGVALALAQPAGAAGLQAGVGRSDITPPTGFPTMGYVRDDAIARGQHTRLFARAIVFRQGDTKLALVTTDLGFTPGGLLEEVAAREARRGFSQRNVIISASHTHSGPAGFSNFQSDNFVAPTSGTPTDFKVVGDTRLYGFLIDRVARAIERADDGLGPARAGWGTTSLAGVTDNRSLEAHLADHGLDLPYGTGRVDEDPGGYLHTIDPEVDVLRVDRVTRKRRIPMGAWLNFADHGTVNPFQFGVYNADHHGPASRIFEQGVRKAGRVPAGHEVVGAYGNADAGDMTAALRGRGPAYAERVGRAEARAMLRAWRSAGRHLSGSPAFGIRWTRSCFCGRTVDGGQVADKPVMGFPFFTGSEENRGPLFDQTHVNHEGMRLPVGVGPQSRKIQTLGPPAADFPSAVPLMVVRFGNRLMATIPGEMTAEMGRRTRAAVLGAARGAGVTGVALVGYANEFLHYFTTPEEYDQQHYEGGSTLFGKYSSNLIMDDLATLAGRLVGGTPAPDPVSFDPRDGVIPDTRPYESGADRGVVAAQPGPAARLSRAEFSWRGGERGLDRPLDRAFVSVQRRAGRRWRRVTDDLGLEILWRVDDSGRYLAQWQVPLSARRARYRFVITANHYRLASAPFRVVASTAVGVHVVSRTARRALLALDYPPADVLKDLTSRPAHASGGRVTAVVGRRAVTVRRRRSQIFSIPARAGTPIRIPAGLARDRFGNRNAKAISLGTK